MKESIQAGLDYANGKISHLFGKIFFPTLLGMLFTALITIVDGIFVGQGVGPEGIAAVNIIAPLYMISTGIGLMMGIGASVRAGVSMAEGDYKRTNTLVSQSFITASTIMTVIISIVLIFPERICRILGSSDLLLPHALDYLEWLIPGTLFLSWSCIGMMVIRLDGSPKFAMMINIVSALLNIAGDYILIFPLGMGVKGAAIATAGSIAIGGIMALLYFRKSYIIKLTADTTAFVSNMLSIVSIGSSAFVTEIAMSVMMFTGNYVFMNYYGDNGVAAYSIACYLFPLFFMMSNAVAQSAQPIISYNVGINSVSRVSQAFQLSKCVAFICGIAVCLFIAFCAPAIVNLFIPTSSEAGKLAVDGLPVFSVCAVFFALNIAYIGYFQSVGWAGYAMIFTLLRGVILLVPLFYIMPHISHQWGTWSAIPCAELLTYLIILFCYRRIKTPYQFIAR